jgi:uncharacterized protein (TIGR02246 family)
MPNRFLISLAFLFAFVPAAYAEEVYRDCSNLVTDYAMYRDRFDAEAFSNLFTEDASLTVLSQTWEGRDSIRQRIAELDSSGSIRHLMSSIRITPVNADHASGISYATIYSAPAGARTVEGPALIGEYHDDFVLTTDGWKIEKRVLHSVFGYADN